MNPPSPRSRPQFDEVVDAIGHRYRRRLLVALADRNPQDDSDPQEAAEALGALLDDEVDATKVETELHHVHLPKLAAEGYIVWDQERGIIEKGPNWDEIAPVIRLLQEHADELPDGWL